MDVASPRAGRTQRDLAALFDLHRLGDGVWLGPGDLVKLPQPFGGQLVGQSLVAAGRSIGPELRVHSVHTAFLAAGRSGEDVRYAVEVVSDGRSRATRQVDARQGDRLICRSFVSATVDREGMSHSRPAPAPGPFETSVPLHVLAEPDGGLGGFWDGFEAIEVRVAPGDGGATRNIWMRAAEPLPADPLLHRAAVAYASDLMLMGTATALHGVPTGHERTLAAQWWGVSLDHTLWFHDDVPGDEWLVYEHTTPMAHAARALIQAAAFTRSGTPVCHVAQEALIRRQR